MMLYKEAAFWTAWIEYIEENPTEDQWEKAATTTHTEALSCRNCPDLFENLGF